MVGEESVKSCWSQSVQTAWCACSRNQVRVWAWLQQRTDKEPELAGRQKTCKNTGRDGSLQGVKTKEKMGQSVGMRSLRLLCHLSKNRKANCTVIE